ncbi:DUF4870 domain-containing protein [Demequina sp.]|uniref:DUF4870 domain-containing protein n=1 Tax=Demequina sp. TaxID=2050685 RepID=UPI003A87AF81
MNDSTVPPQPPQYDGAPQYSTTPPYQAAPQPGYSVPTPPYSQPAMLESQARMWSMLIHIIAAAAMFLSAGFLGFVVPLVLWLMYRERSALIDFHGKQNLNLQLSVLVTGIAAFIVGLLLLGVGLFVTIPLWLLYGFYALVISIIAGIKANNGEYFKVPAVIPFVR